MTPFSNNDIIDETSIWRSNLHESNNHMCLTILTSKASQQHRDDDATAYSSWNEDEADEFSSCRSTTVEDASLASEDQVDEDDDCVTSSEPQEELYRTILTERTAMLLRKESSMEYRVVDNYCVNETAVGSNLSLQAIAYDSFTEDAIFCASKARPASEIDASCRSKMMEWAIRVVEFSYPPPQSSFLTSTNTRRHSRETLHIISTAFSYVDRIMGQSRVHANYETRKKAILRITTRKEYKLLCMICLHLAAKMSGLFDSSGVDQPVVRQVEGTGSCVAKKASKSDSNSSLTSSASDFTAITTCSSSNSISDISQSTCASKNSSKATPRAQSHVVDYHHFIPRPSLRLLSLHGLHSLCQGEFTINEMCHMELSILTSLEWKMNSGLVLEWLDLIFDWSALLFRGTPLDSSDEVFDWEEIRERAYVQLEAVIQSHEFMTVIPSILALATVANALEDHDKTLDWFDLVLNLTEVLGVPFCIEDLNGVMTAMERRVNNNS